MAISFQLPTSPVKDAGCALSCYNNHSWACPLQLKRQNQRITCRSTKTRCRKGGEWKALIRQDNADVVSTQENPRLSISLDLPSGFSPESGTLIPCLVTWCGIAYLHWKNFSALRSNLDSQSISITRRQPEFSSFTSHKRWPGAIPS
jgi:hypothetical protein